MAYIPEAHKKYNLLPRCRDEGGEVFSYSSALISAIEALCPGIPELMPYGHRSYDRFYKYLDAVIEEVKGHCNAEGDDSCEVVRLLTEYKEDIRKRNVKENWSVVKYVGETIENFFTHGRHYYWPCHEGDPVYEGIIDDEEFSSYTGFFGEPNVAYDIDSDLSLERTSYTKRSGDWEIAEDPLGIAHRELFQNRTPDLNGPEFADTSLLPPGGTTENMKMKTLTKSETEHLEDRHSGVVLKDIELTGTIKPAPLRLEDVDFEFLANGYNSICEEFDEYPEGAYPFSTESMKERYTEDANFLDDLSWLSSLIMRRDDKLREDGDPRHDPKRRDMAEEISYIVRELIHERDRDAVNSLKSSSGGDREMFEEIDGILAEWNFMDFHEVNGNYEFTALDVFRILDERKGVLGLREYFSDGWFETNSISEEKRIPLDGVLAKLHRVAEKYKPHVSDEEIFELLYGSDEDYRAERKSEGWGAFTATASLVDKDDLDGDGRKAVICGEMRMDEDDDDHGEIINLCIVRWLE